MTTEQLCQIAIDRGYRYNPETGEIFGIKGKLLKAKDKDGYIVFKVITNGKSKKSVKAHRFGFYWVHKYLPNKIDHINRIRHDNNINNLRASNDLINAQNTLGKGIHKVIRKNKVRYRVRITVNYKSIHLGIFDTEQEARQAYLDAKKKYHNM